MSRTLSFKDLPPDPSARRRHLLLQLNTPKRFIYDAGHPKDRKLLDYVCRKPFDVIIAGGGPAGIYAAATLSNQGVRCVLLEKDLFLDTNNTIAVPHAIVERYSLEASVARKHKDTEFSDYFGLRYPAQLDYCILDQTKAHAVLAAAINPDYGTVVENCEARSFVSHGHEVSVKTQANTYALMPYRQALRSYPRAMGLLDVNETMFGRHNPWVKLNTTNESEMGAPKEQHSQFTGSLLVEAAGYLSNISNSLHRNRYGNVWKCLVWEFEDVHPAQIEILWNMSEPTQSHTNFWVDVAGPHDVAVGVMVLAETSPTSPNAYPPKRDLETQLTDWIGRSSIHGRMVRERYGIIPMTDFREPAVYDNAIFVGVSAVRHVPNTGFGFFPALHEAKLASETILQALSKAKAAKTAPQKTSSLGLRALRCYDLAWLRQRELSMALDLVFQDLHLAARTDEHFHDFARVSTEMPTEIVKRRILAEMGPAEIGAFTRLFLRNTFLLDLRRYKPEYHRAIARDLGRVIYCLLSNVLRFYCPEGSEMFEATTARPGLLGSAHILLRRKMPEKLCVGLAHVLFIRPFRTG